MNNINLKNLAVACPVKIVADAGQLRKMEKRRWRGRGCGTTMADLGDFC